MKNRFIAHTLGVFMLAAAAAPAWSISLATVGSTDTLLGSTVLDNSGDAEETAWASSILGFDVSFGSKIEGLGPWAAIDGISDLYAIDFGSAEPDYFLVKTGGGKKYEGSTHFLFQNTDELQYGVVNFEDMGISEYSIDRISHATTFGGATQVPEPATLALFGVGALAVVMSRRRRLVPNR